MKKTLILLLLVSFCGGSEEELNQSTQKNTDNPVSVVEKDDEPNQENNSTKNLLKFQTSEPSVRYLQML